MTNLCLYFQVHQPFRIRPYPLFDIGKRTGYFDLQKNEDVMKKVAGKCYLPANKVILDLIHKHDDFKAAYSITGTALEQFSEYAPRVLESFEALAATGAVEFLSETSHHSLSFLFDKDEFAHQVSSHKKMVKEHFGQKPTVFRNTELIYSNEVAKAAEDLGYKAVLAEGWDGILGWRSPNYVYSAAGTKKMRLLLKNYRLSDDIAFRFSDKNWSGHPLTAEKYADWLAPILGDSVNLFMDYETFGEHQWEDTGIFNFLRALPRAVSHHGISFTTPSALAKVAPKETLDVPHYVSWADTERDTTAWLGNGLQQSASKKLYQLKESVLSSKDAALIDAWRKLTTSDHFYYMCTKWFADGDVHKYFNPHDSPYEAYITFMNILQDMEIAVKQKNKGVFTKLARLIAEV